MTFIDGLYGDVAVVVLCGVLFAGEAGVPLPVSGELVLIAGGILVGTGAVDPWLFVPLAIVACLGGAFAGFSWARLVGENGLQAAAERLGQGRRLAKLSARLGRAGPLRIALFRLTPGFKVYTSLVAGAAGVDRRRFLIGVGPLIVLWVAVFTTVGAVVGVPASRFLSELQNLVLQGGLLIGIGAGAYLVVRRVPAGGRAALARLPLRLRVALAVAVDVALIATVAVGVLRIVSGLLAIAYPWLPVAAFAWWVELLAIVLVIVVFYSVATRRGLRATAGETLFDTRYLTGGADDGRVRLSRLLRAGLDEEPAPPAALVRMSAPFRALADARRLQVARLLLQRDASAEEVASTLALTAGQASDALADLEDAGLLAGTGEGSDRRYTMASDHVRLGLAELLAHVGSEESGQRRTPSDEARSS
jgi:membrane protein DedA with SNARE-associated domain/DNA-binding transcriptional ArsR family regulator